MNDTVEGEKATYHKWLVLSVTVPISTIVAGTMNGFGTFFIPLLEKFEESHSLTPSIHALLLGNSLSFGIVSGMLVTKIGVPRAAFIGALLLSLGFGLSFFATSIPFLCVTIGGVAGIGNSLLFISSTAAVGYTFSGTQRILAVSIQNVGTNIGGMVFPNLITWLLDEFGMMGTFLIIGAICLHLTIPAIVYNFEDGIVTQEMAISQAERKQIRQTSTKNQKFFQCSIGGIKDWIHVPYLIVVSANCLCSASINSMLVIVVDMFVWNGVSVEKGPVVFLVFNLTGMLTRLFPGLLKYFYHDSNTCIPPLIFLLLGTAAMICTMLGNKFEILMVGMGFLGIPFGGVVVSATILIVTMTPPDKIALAIGLLKTVTGLLTITAGPFFGAIYDKTDSYKLVLTSIGAIQLACMFLFMAALSARRTRRISTKRIQNLVFGTAFLRPELWAQ